MLVNFQETEYCKVEVHYEADVEDVKNKRQEIISKFRDRKVSGFRAGKAPDSAVELQYKKEIDENLKATLAQKAFDDILFETKIKSVGYPQYSSVNLKNNKFTCDLFLLKRPDFELKEYKDLEIPKPHSEKNAEQLTESIIQDFRMKNADIVPFEENDFAQLKDQLTIDFKITVDGELINGGSGEGVLYEVGSRSFEPFDDNLLGIKAGETRDFEITLPGYVQNYAGKSAQASVTCHMGSKKVPPPLDDLLATKAGFKDMQELINKATGLATASLQQSQELEIINQVSKKLVSLNDINLPEFLVSSEVKNIIFQQKIQPETLIEENIELIKSKAIENTKLALILDAIREKEPDATLSDTECFNILKERVNSLSQNPNEVFAELQKSGNMIFMLASLKNDHTLKWVASKTKIIE